MTYQNVTGCLSQGAHPGSYNGQDAYNDMLVVDDGVCTASVRGVSQDGYGIGFETKRLQGCHRFDSRGGVLN